MNVHKYASTPTQNHLKQANDMFGESYELILEHSRGFVNHVNSNETVELVKNIISSDLIKGLLSGTEVCGYNLNKDTGWGKYLPLGQIVSFDLSEHDIPYLMINLQVFSQASYEQALTSLFHEMVHVNQLTSKSLKKQNGLTFWLDEDWSDRFEKAYYEMTVNNNETLYRRLPWEIEAYDLESKFKKRLSKSKSKLKSKSKSKSKRKRN